MNISIIYKTDSSQKVTVYYMADKVYYKTGHASRVDEEERTIGT